MKKNLFILIILSLAFYSCGNSFGGFDPRNYNSKADISEDEEEQGGGGEIDPNDDPFQDHTDPNVNFDADKFKSWSFRVVDINGDNVPSYAFESDKTWGALDPLKGEYSHGGGNIGSGVKTLKNVVYYKYESKNPRYGADSEYNNGPHGERMERFYFYRFTGKALAGPPLNNYVIAIDTYTKLVFAYAVPTESVPVMSGYPNVPTAWGSVDKETIGPGGKQYSFYEYDPVGIVSADGSVEIYKWFYNILASDKYDPIIAGHSEVATYKQPGKSPYLSASADGDIDLFVDYIKDKTFSLRDTDPNTIEDTLTLNTYTFSSDGKTLEHKKTEWFGDGTPVVVTTYSDYKKINGTSGEYAGTAFRVENKSKLYKGNKHIGTLGYKDDPVFLDRVKGATFGNGSNWKFTDNGKNVVINGDSYQYEKSRDGVNGTTALYGWKNGMGVWYFYSVKLYKSSGKNDQMIMRGSSGGGKDAPVWDVTMTDAGYRTTAPPPPAEDLFLKTVARKTYSLRDTTQTTVLHKYIFSSDGKTVTHKTKVWDVSEDNFIKEYTGYTKATATTGSYSGTAFEIRGNDLYKNNVHVGTYNYNDPGVNELTVTVTAKKLNNINWTSTANNKKLPYGGFSHSVRAGVFKEGEANKNYKVLDHLSNGERVAGDSSTWNIKKGEHLNLSGSTSGVYYDTKSHIKIELDGIVRLHNFGWGVEGARGTKNTETSALHGKPVITLVYNKDTKVITVDPNSPNSGSTVNANGTTVLLTYDANFTVREGESKEFTITYGKVWDGNPNNAVKVSVTYNIDIKDKKVK